MGRAPCCDKSSVKKGPWSEEEDKQLKEYIEKHGTGGNWIALPLKAGLKRCGKSCRLRWLNYLRPNIKHGDFSPDEDSIICYLYASIGSRWSIMASQLPGRTDNDIKNYWNTKLKKKFLGITPRKRQHYSSSQVIGGIAAATAVASSISPYLFDSLAPSTSSPFLQSCSFINGQEHLCHRTELMGLENYCPYGETQNMLLGSDSSSPSLSSDIDKFEEVVKAFGTDATVSTNYECNDYLNDPNCSVTGEVGWTASCMYL